MKLMTTYEQGRNAMKEDILLLIRQCYPENCAQPTGSPMQDLIETIERMK